MKYIVFLFAIIAAAQTPPPSSNASTLRGKGPCSATVTSDCITTNVGGTVYGGGSGAGDVAGPAASVDSEVAIYSGTGGKTLKRFNGSGVLVGTSGVVSTDSGFQFNGTTKSLGVFGPIVTGQTSNYLGQILMNGITSGTITIQPANAAGTWTWTLPANDGDSGQVLQTNGSGVTSWAAAGTGNMVNTGTPTATALPKYSDTTGTALAPSGVLVDSNNDVTGIRNLTVTGTITAGAAGAIDLTAITAPATPAAGKGALYVDSTSKNIAVKDDAGVVKHGVQTKTAASNQVLRAIADDGTVTQSALASADIPNNAANTTGSAATLTTTRAIYGNNFNGSAALTQIIASTYGGTGNGFTKFAGPATSEKTFTLPNANSTLMATDTALADAQLAAKHKTRTQSMTVFDPVTGDSGRVQMMFPYAVTVTSISCSVKAATSATINLDERAFATPDTAGTAVLTSALACDTDGATSTTFTNAGLAANVPVALLITAVSGTPDTLRVYVTYSVD